jgi:hypothetical protein
MCIYIYIVYFHIPSNVCMCGRSQNRCLDADRAFLYKCCRNILFLFFSPCSDTLHTCLSFSFSFLLMKCLPVSLSSDGPCIGLPDVCLFVLIMSLCLSQGTVRDFVGIVYASEVFCGGYSELNRTANMNL